MTELNNSGNFYSPDIFYETTHLSISEKSELLKDAHNKCFNWWTDILDVSKSIARQRIEMPFDDMLKKLSSASHFVFIHRRGYSNWQWKLEIGFCTMSNPDYYLFIEVDENIKQHFIQKFKLVEMNK